MEDFSLKNLRIFCLFCYNRIDFQTFQNMQSRDPNSNFAYDLEKFEEFKNNPVKFMIENNSILLFSNIKNEIILSGYNG